MVRDFPNSTDQPDEIGLTIYLSGVLSRSSLKRSGNGGFIQMVSNVPPFQSELKKKEYLWRYSTISERNYRKITLPFDRNFRIFWPDEHPGEEFQKPI